LWHDCRLRCFPFLKRLKSMPLKGGNSKALTGYFHVAVESAANQRPNGLLCILLCMYCRQYWKIPLVSFGMSVREGARIFGESFAAAVVNTFVQVVWKHYTCTLLLFHLSSANCCTSITLLLLSRSGIMGCAQSAPAVQEAPPESVPKYAELTSVQVSSIPGEPQLTQKREQPHGF